MSGRPGRARRTQISRPLAESLAYATAALKARSAVQGHGMAGRFRSVGSVSWDCLATMSPAAAEGFLKSLPGVGTKVAKCVLGYSRRMPVFRRSYPESTRSERLMPSARETVEPGYERHGMDECQQVERRPPLGHQSSG
jgi:hypothetical protein